MNPDDDRLARIRLMLGESRLARLRGSFVVVVGLGAVGSYAVEGLARAGVGRLRLADFDIIKASNINRQLYALESTLGMKKCDIARRRVLDINPDCRVEALDIFADGKTIPAILAGNPDIVIDAIDSMGPKTELIRQAASMGLTLISSMGAALRTDPSRVRAGHFHEARKCPLARRVRDLLTRRGAKAPDFLCVYSDEPVARGRRLKPADSDDPALRGRTRAPLGSLPTVTGIFGLTIANAAIQKICGGDTI